MSEKRKKCAAFAVSSGKPCSKYATPGSDFCATHGKSAKVQAVTPARKENSHERWWISKEFLAFIAFTGCLASLIAILMAWPSWQLSRREFEANIDIQFDLALTRTNSLPARFRFHNNSKFPVSDVKVTYDAIERAEYSDMDVFGKGNVFDYGTKLPFVGAGRQSSFILDPRRGFKAESQSDQGVLLSEMTVVAAYTYEGNHLTNRFGFQAIRDAAGELQWAPLGRE